MVTIKTLNRYALKMFAVVNVCRGIQIRLLEHIHLVRYVQLGLWYIKIRLTLF